MGPYQREAGADVPEDLMKEVKTGVVHMMMGEDLHPRNAGGHQKLEKTVSPRASAKSTALPTPWL